ncbi:Glutathione S-transferase [Mycena venus]|uniref:glutathione transferase n=1 Tax=Mycena venus TaxID=2733690 RepID=A0A8H6Y0X2_9AGAR|nr:Glutathione S-transferase [Mycena venus]
MVLNLYGMGISTCTRRVAAILLEKKVPFLFVSVDAAKAEHKSAAYLKKQQFGQVPYIVRLFLFYLPLPAGFHLREPGDLPLHRRKYANQGTLLVPIGTKEKALFEQAASVEYCKFERLASKAVGEMVFKPMFGQAADKALFDSLIENLSAKLDAYEVILGMHKYLAGNEVTLVNLFHLPYTTMLAQAANNDHQASKCYQVVPGYFWKTVVKKGVESTISY